MDRKEIEKQYNKIVSGIEEAKIYDGRGVYDSYKCQKCGREKITLYKDKGVTPFVISCCKCNGGDMIHTNSFSHPHLSNVKVYNWIRPTLEQTFNLSAGLRNHVLNGGLVLEEDI